ncbi:rab GTPase-binding effector protein 1-like [Hemitrygon akajei]|uniref:rab GTPase-binding effector protein 1-like n=1 Tax=Hemitrygon akajei TaxID=2704970 RepID=UPI003BF998E4
MAFERKKSHNRCVREHRPNQCPAYGKICNVCVTGYSGADIPVKGTCVAKVSHKNIVHTLSFVVVPKTVWSILGLSACERLNLVKRVLVLDGDTELKRQNVALQLAEGDVTRLQVQLVEANADMQNMKAVAAVSEMTKQEAIDDVKKQWQEEVASMQAIMKESLREHEIQFHHCLEQESSQWAQYKEEVKAQVKELRSFIEMMKSQHKKEITQLMNEFDEEDFIRISLQMEVEHELTGLRRHLSEGQGDKVRIQDKMNT